MRRAALRNPGHRRGRRILRLDPISLLACASLLAVLSAPAHAITSRTLFAPVGAAVGDNLGNAVDAAGDVNGDGYPDVIVGAPFNDAVAANAGRAFVFFGGPTADAVADWVLSGAAANDQFGYSVGPAGDVNGDGYADVIVGAPANDAGGVDAGRAYVFFGGPAPNSVADLTLTGAAASDFFGTAVAAAGDVTGDGFDDVIVGAPANDATGANAGRAYVYYGGPFADAVADLILSGVAAGDQFGTSVAPAGDLNRDGYSDVIVGAPNNDAGGADAGQAYVFFGSVVANASPDLTLTGLVVGDFFGDDVAGAGDVNGDGFDDVIVGAPDNDTGASAAGQAYVFYGGGVADATADVTFTGAGSADLLGSAVGGAGDVNGDGFADLIVGAYNSDVSGSGSGVAFVYFGGSSANSLADVYLPGEVAGDGLGFSVAGVGDVDGDGYDDVIVGAPFSDLGGSNSGKASVVLIYPYQLISPNGGERWVSGQPATVHWLGHDVADISVSQDGGATYSTLAFGVGGAEDNQVSVIAPGPGTDLARVRVSQRGLTATHSVSDASDGVFRIVAATDPPAAALRLQLTPTGAAAGDLLGNSVATAGDVNGDGFDDVIAGAPFNDAGGANAGRAYVYFGGPAADAVADWTLTGAAVADEFGYSVGSAGDVNADGYADIIVGAPFNDAGGADAGRAYVFFGGPAPDAIADLTLTALAAGDNLGYSVGTAGDANGDGFADLIVGAVLNDVAAFNSGAAYLFYGGRTPDALADLTMLGDAANVEFGICVGTAGDVNGDGYADVIVGAPLSDGIGLNSGHAYIYFLGPTADAIADLTLSGEAAGDEFGFNAAAAGDVNGDGYSDVIAGARFNDAGSANAGRAYVYFGGPGADAIADLILTGAVSGDNFGVGIGTAGDVNGDGYADILVGAPLNDAGGASAGRVYVYYGGPAPDPEPDATLTGAAANDQFGAAAAAAGEFDGDGFDDLVLSALANDAGGADAGRIYLYACNRYFLLAPNDDEVWNVGASQTVTWLGAERADLWLSSDGGNSYELLRHDVGGSGSNSLALLVPHTPTRFARVKVTPANLNLTGADESDSLFTIQTGVALLSLVAELVPDGGALLKWSTDPGVGPAGLAGYRVYRVGSGGPGTRLGPDLIAEGRYLDSQGGAGTRYRVAAVNGLGEELTLGEISLVAARPLAAWPLPYRGGALHVSFATAGGLGGGAGEASVELFDLAGRKVRTIASGMFAAGYRAAEWDGRDGAGRAVGRGVYFLRMRSGGAEHSIKIAVVE